MTEAPKAPRLTCGLVVVGGVLGLSLVLALQRQPVTATWETTGAAALAAVAAFGIVRGATHFFWGLLAAVLLTLHPAWTEPAFSADGTMAGALVLAAAAATAFAWQLTFHPRFAWRSWLPVLAAIAVCAGLAWTRDAYLGLLALALAVVPLAVALVLGVRLRQREVDMPPSRLNLVLAGIGILLLPVTAVLAYRFFDRSLIGTADWWPLFRDALPEGLQFSQRAFDETALEAWCWPHYAAVLPVVGLAVLLTLRRGWKEWGRRQVPAAWFVTLLALVLLAALFVQPQPAGPALPLILTAAVVLLVVSLAADLLRRFFDRLVLLPPQERGVEGAMSAPSGRG